MLSDSEAPVRVLAKFAGASLSLSMTNKRYQIPSCRTRFGISHKGSRHACS
jgi:hypothetical protein